MSTLNKSDGSRDYRHYQIIIVRCVKVTQLLIIDVFQNIAKIYFGII